MEISPKFPLRTKPGVLQRSTADDLWTQRYQGVECWKLGRFPRTTKVPVLCQTANLNPRVTRCSAPWGFGMTPDWEGFQRASEVNAVEDLRLVANMAISSPSWRPFALSWEMLVAPLHGVDAKTVPPGGLRATTSRLLLMAQCIGNMTVLPVVRARTLASPDSAGVASVGVCIMCSGQGAISSYIGLVTGRRSNVENVPSNPGLRPCIALLQCYGAYLWLGGSCMLSLQAWSRCSHLGKLQPANAFFFQVFA